MTWADLVATVTDAGGVYGILGVVLVQLRVMRATQADQASQIERLQIRTARMERDLERRAA